MLKNLIKKFLSLFDIKISRYSSSFPLDLSKEKIHPRTIENLIDQKKAIVNLDFEKGRTNRFFSLKPESFDPYLFSINYCLRKNLSKNNLHSAILEMINIYKNKVNIKNLSIFYGLEDEKNTKLNNFPIWANVLPWENISFANRLINFPKSVKADRKKNGFFIKSNDPDIIMKEDQKNSLPSHINQYVNLINSINKIGFVSDHQNNYIETEFLVKGDEFCWKPRGEGNHRVTVAASLGYKNIKSIVTNIVRYDELNYWPNVVNGTFKKTEAEQIFNRYFYAKPPEFNKNWILYCKELTSDKK